MQRYFAKDKIGYDDFILYDSDLHHIKNVMRGKIDDLIEIVYNETIYTVKITSLTPFKGIILEEHSEDRENIKPYTIAISLVNEQKMDIILQKITELGVSKVIPLVTDRSIVRLSKEKEIKKITRWQMIMKEASEQSKRTLVPTITNIMTIDDLIKEKYSNKYICSLTESSKPISKCLNANNENMIFVIGPEGGFTIQEEDKLISNGFQPITLGKRVLRVETAAIYVASIVNYISEVPND